MRIERGSSAQALVEFAFILPVTLILLLGMIDLGRAFVFGVAVQEGARAATRLASQAALDPTISDTTLRQRLIDSSAPALVGCSASSNTCTDGAAGTWTYSLRVATGTATYTSLSAARAGGDLSGARVTVTQ